MATKIQKSVQFERHEDDEFYDEVRLRVVERWKESELSGDEWRFSYVVEFCRKGQVLIQRGFSRLEWALAHVPSIPLNDLSYGADEEHQDVARELTKYTLCFQPGCTNDATREFRLLKLFTPRSGVEMPASDYYDHRVRYCDRHAENRGDCGLMDSDSNLVEVPLGSDAEAGAWPKQPNYMGEEAVDQQAPCLRCPTCTEFVFELPSGTAGFTAELTKGRSLWRQHRYSCSGLTAA